MIYDSKYYKTTFKKSNGKRGFNFLYRKFLKMKERVYNKNSRDYKNYGGRGIEVETYLLNFKNYVDYLLDILPEGIKIEDVQKDKLTIDRIDNNGDYVRGNLRWASRIQQNVNRRKLKNNTSGFQGVSWYKPLNKWVARIGKSRTYIGYYNTKEEAFKAYCKRYKELYDAEAYQYMLSQHPHWESK